MPFTLSHAAASLPFRRFKPVWPALIVGTFAPDLQYFILISDKDRSGHHYPQVLLYTIPFALLVLWIFERVVKGPAIELLPSALQSRLQGKLEPLSFAGLKQFGSIVLWVVVGVGTHLAWDQFTHAHSWTASHWTILRTMVHPPLLHSISVARLLQHLSTIGGMAVLAVWLAHWYRRTLPAQPTHAEAFSSRLKAAVILAMCAIALLCGYLLAMWRLANHPAPIRTLVIVVTTFVASTMVFCLQLLVYGLAITMSTRARRAMATQRN
jgi:Domain of unknown function (DUF4184)